MNPNNRTALVPIRPEKPTDADIAERIKLVAQVVENASEELIGVTLHDCDYNVQKTIDRLQSQDYSNDDWKPAKSTNKRKNVLSSTSNNKETLPNGNNASVSSTTSSKVLNPRNIKKSRSSNVFIEETTNETVSSETPSGNSNEQISNIVVSEDANSNEIVQENPPEKLVENKDEEKPLLSNVSKVPKKVSSSSSINSSRSKRRTNSSIPAEPVRIHRSVPALGKSIDVQFGDILWINSKPTIDLKNENSTIEEEQNTKTEDAPVEETTTPTENSMNTSHASHFESSSNNPGHFLAEQSVSATQSSPVSTSRRSNLTSPNSNSHYLPPHHNQIQEPNNENSSHMYTSFNMPPHYPNNQVDYGSTHVQWSQQTGNYKSNSKLPLMSVPGYSTQTLYSAATAQQAPFFTTYPIITPTTQLVPVVLPAEHWQTPFISPLDMHPYGPAGFSGGYPNIQGYPGAKYTLHNYYDQSQYVGPYGQSRTIETDPNYFQQSNKEITTNSKLSVTAQPFQHGGSNSAVYQNSHAETRHGASYNASNPRNNAFHHEQSQRTYTNNSSNINRHLQQ